MAACKLGNKTLATKVQMRPRLQAIAGAALVASTVLWGCVNLSAPGKQNTRPTSLVARGEYLATLLGCGQCHTEGALLGKPSGPWLAGAITGIAYTADNQGANPGIVFPANLTPDNETGLGTWTEGEIVAAIGGGTSHTGHRLSAVMPWLNYSLVRSEDLRSIAAYLKSLPAIEQAIPENIAPGETVTSAYIRVGMYLFSPSGTLRTLTEPATTD